MADEDVERCPACGSSESYLDEDGRWYCQNGHGLDRATATVEDEGDPSNRGKVTRKREAKEKIRVSKVLRGAKAYRLFVQSWQFILWKQCHTLVHRKGLPEQLWPLVRDLWTLWLSELSGRIDDSAPPVSLASENESEHEHENQTAETDTDGADYIRRGSRQTPKQALTSPKLIDTVALNVLGIILLRRPVSMATILDWVHREEIPYIRAIRFIPFEMKSRLPSEYHRALDTVQILEPEHLQVATYRLATMYRTAFGLSLPPLNHTLLLVNYLQALSLPLEVYAGVKRLNLIVKYAFAYDENVSESRRNATTYPEVQLMSLLVVATKLLFPFDSNQISYHPTDSSGLSNLQLNWSVWASTRSSAPPDDVRAAGQLSQGSEIHVTDRDVLDMSKTQLDQYMDWFQRTFVESQTSSQPTQTGPNTLDKSILDMFPLKTLPPTQKMVSEDLAGRQREKTVQLQVTMAVQQSLAQNATITMAEEQEMGTKVHRSGERYPRFKNLADLEGAASLCKQDGDARGRENIVRRFHEDAARLACVDPTTLLRAVYATEEKIEKWRMLTKKKDFFGDDEDINKTDHGQEKVGGLTGAARNLESKLGQLDIDNSSTTSDDELEDEEMEDDIQPRSR